MSEMDNQTEPAVPYWALRAAAKILKDDANRLAYLLDSKELKKYDPRVEDGVRAEMDRIRKIEDLLVKNVPASEEDLA